MGSFEVKFKRSAEKDLRRLPKDVIKRVFTKIEELKQNALPMQAIKLRGTERIYRIRVGDYRIIYEVDVKTKTIVIHYIRHRKEVYRRMPQH